MRFYLSIFLVLMVFTACDGGFQNGGNTSTSTNNNTMRQDALKVIEHYCKGQAKQVEISRKMSEYQEKKQTPPEEILAQLDEANKHMELYTNALQEIMNKYKGQERAVQNILKEEYQNCKW